MLSQDDYIKRINHLLYNHDIDQAARLLPYLPSNHRKTCALRIDMKKGKAEVNAINPQTDMGILHDLAVKLDKDNDEENLVNTLELVSGINHASQAYFWRLKVKFIRNLIQRKDYKIAYLFASSHGNEDAKEYSEAEWLSGWIALRFMNLPKLAVKHFGNFYKKVKLPISLSRGAYWLGRSYAKLNEQEKSIYWYKKAAQYFTSFYGQLAICKINNCQLQLPSDYKITKAEAQKYSSSPLVKAAVILEKTRYSFLSKVFLLKAIENSHDPKEIVAITRLRLEQDHHLSTELAKQAGYKNIMVLEAGYPRPKFVYHKDGIDRALVLALIRQESVFNHQAVSTAGAMGLMQIMPHVAKKAASNIKVKYHQSKLIKDPLFNTRLGVSHLEELLRSYDNSYILSIAAYNAGSKAVNKWIEDNGDPRLMKTEEELVDWMEKITFHETRNYVQRVLENRAMYHAILNKNNKLRIRY